MDELSRAAVAAAEGDHVAARHFVVATQADVWQLCSYLGSGSDTDDLVQETYVRAFRALASYRSEAPVRNWLLAIARRVCADEVRRRARRRRGLQRLSQLTDAAATAEPEPGIHLVLEQLLDRLDPDRRDAFVLTQLIGLRYDEAAEVCGCALGTIRSRVARARADLLALVADADVG